MLQLEIIIIITNLQLEIIVGNYFMLFLHFFQLQFTFNIILY